MLKSSENSSGLLLEIYMLCFVNLVSNPREDVITKLLKLYLLPLEDDYLETRY